MATVKIDQNKKIGSIKPMHAVGQPPFAGGSLGFDFSHIGHLKNANIPYSRLHDVNGVFGGSRFVDIPNIFRNFDADETDPASYDFAFTDVLIEAMYSYNVKPIFRLGVTIENQCNIKAYRIDPPKDFSKWARICEHIIRHYNEGWADGYTYGIEYWEIWNEPDNSPAPETNQMWTGTPEEFYKLYDVTAKHLKSCFGDSIKVGGYGCCGIGAIFYHPEEYGVDCEAWTVDENYDRYTYRAKFFIGFLEYLKEHKPPIDFFSWHSYFNTENTRLLDEFIHRKLSEYGYGELETHLNEWNNACRGGIYHGTSFASASVAAMMLSMQNSHADMLCYYDTRLVASVYGGFFAPLTYEPVSTYYSFAAFGKLYALGTQVESCVECEDKGFYAVAASNGRKNAVMLVNQTGKTQELTFEGVDLSDAHVYKIDQKHLMSIAFNTDKIDNDTVIYLEF
ncbi:MAG: hypothetical protein E7607_05625 [Ruminococcaceae bacterium]|nr:hypothetical protein [Oscillospiraceae bacterium]